MSLEAMGKSSRPQHIHITSEELIERTEWHLGNEFVKEVPRDQLVKEFLRLTTVEEVIFSLGILTAVAILPLHRDFIGGNPVPVPFSKSTPSIFHAFLISLNFGFTAAVVTMSLRAKRPALAQLCRKSAVVCAVVAAGLLSYSALLPQ